MAIQVLPGSIGDKPCVPAFFMVRLPILDRRQEAAAFDLSFYPADGAPGTADGRPRLTTAILAHVAELDLLKAVGDLRGIVAIDMAALASDIFQHIPRTKFVFSLDGRVTADAAMLARLAMLREHGFTFALGEWMTDEDSLRKLIPLVEVVRFDLRRRTLDQLAGLTSQAHFASKKLLVENVDTLAQFDACLALGFDYVQGDYFARPAIDLKHRLAPSQAAIIELIALVSGDADDAAIENRIKRDVSLGLSLLRLVNSAAVGVHRIDSLRQALMVLGRQQLAHWLQVMLYTQARENIPSIKPLLMLATTRDKLMELIALHHRPGNRGIADAAFTVGIMSLMDSLFGMLMAEILRQIPVVGEIGDALGERRGYYGDLLALVAALEQREEAAALMAMLEQFHMDSSALYRLQVQAFEWSNRVTQALHA